MAVHFSEDTKELLRDQIIFLGGIKLKTCVETGLRMVVTLSGKRHPPEADG